MNARDLQDFGVLCVLLRRTLPTDTYTDGMVALAAVRLRHLARALQLHHERECSDERYVNGGTAERRAATLERRLEALAKQYGLRLVEQSDPRGAALRVLGLSDTFGRPAYNTFGGEESGYAVPD